MRYYRMQVAAAHLVQAEVWATQVAVGCPLSQLRMNAVGLGASLWTEDIQTEALLLRVLKDMQIVYEADDTQQVVAKGFGIG